MIFLDTHVVVWLYADPANLIPGKVRERINLEEPRISPAVLLEMEFLREIGRLRVAPDKIVHYLSRSLGLSVDDRSFGGVVRVAQKLSWTRDPFDRLIVAHSTLADADLASKDRLIRKKVPTAFWD